MNDPLAQETGPLTVAAASPEDWHRIAEWAAAEGWNPGHGDVACFHPTDPRGFFIGRLDGEPVSAVSVVTYSDDFAFLGYYLVRPDLRGKGLGLATWRAAFPHAGNRVVGLDAVPAQQANYQRSGFHPSYGTVRHAGRPRRTGAVAPGTVPVGPEHLDAIAAYDRHCFPAERSAFVSRWLTAPGHSAYVRLRDGEVTGYGAIRPGHDAHRIGPLFADTAADAEALFDSLTSGLGPDETVAVDMPDTQKEAGALAAARGLTAQFPTVRMYTGPAPEVRTERIFGVTSLELG
ncbi:N-acetyltransferase GCN5 [Streptomyces inusitatus]|uniref:N-acetyltransferase GCN5 n=1 Tax=Streptomyces inusitatus TaxID=68221 RepID=A0A918Q2X4_9ACTN|nr:GNAT family N-acetyltransferase [Streptomyces inusitatus]GGZ30489.1 N-acetyltransferase GCN5 [Streptomyces inusitatus]